MKIAAEVPTELLKRHSSKNVDTLCVYGVFSSSFYLRDAAGQLSLTHDAVYGNIPFGLAVTDLAAVMKALPLYVGMAGIWVGDLLYIPQVELEVQLSPWNCEAAGIQALPGREVLRQATERALAKLIQTHKGTVIEVAEDGPGPFQNPFARLAVEPLRALEQSMRKNERAGIRQAVLKLLGLGIGLTPSLDDYLSGFLYVLRFAQRSWGLGLPEANLMAELIRELAPIRTGAISATYIIAAADGQYFSILENILLPPLCSNAALDSLLRVGGSSGGDMLSGLIRGLQYIMKHLPVIQS